jgi:hypothetical protein
VAVDEKGNVFRDARGALLEVGDVCVKGAAGDSVTLSVVEILGFKNKVKIGKRDGLGRDYRELMSRQSALDLNPSSWCESTSLIKVDSLPYVADRRNVGSFPAPVPVTQPVDWTPARNWTPDFGVDGR